MMEQIYTERDYAEATKKHTVWLAIMAAVTICAAVFLAVCCIKRWQIAGFVVSGIMAAVWIFSAGLFGRPLRSYRSFMKDMKEGRTRVFAGVISGTDEDYSEQNGVRFVRLFLTETGSGPDEPDKILYYDEAKLPMPIKTGDAVEVELYGNTIKAWKLTEAGKDESLG